MNQLPLSEVGLNRLVPSGLLTLTVLLEMVLLVACRATRWPAFPSKTSIAMRFAAVTLSGFVSPGAMRPVKSTLAAVNGDGGTKKSPELTAVPPDVVTEMCPEVAPVGTVVLMFVAVAEPATALVMLNLI